MRTSSPSLFITRGRILQIHVMAEFAERGLAAMSEALRLAMDYFILNEKAFLTRWLPGRDTEIGRQTTPASWRAIVESLKKPCPAAHRRRCPRANERAGCSRVPVLARRGVLVHRHRLPDPRQAGENARSILALALQPPRGCRYPTPPRGVARRRRPRRDCSHLSRLGDAPGRIQFHRAGGAPG